MLLPDKDYNKRDYLVDALRSTFHYWFDQKRSYFPKYTGIRISRRQWWWKAAKVAGNVVVLCLLLWVAAVLIRH